MICYNIVTLGFKKKNNALCKSTYSVFEWTCVEKDLEGYQNLNCQQWLFLGRRGVDLGCLMICKMDLICNFQNIYKENEFMCYVNK